MFGAVLALPRRRPCLFCAGGGACVEAVVVCSGNTCRSPMAAALCRVLRKEDDVCSAGLYAATGQSGFAAGCCGCASVRRIFAGSSFSACYAAAFAGGGLCDRHDRTHKKQALSAYCAPQKLFTLGELSGGEDVSDP